MSKIPLDVFIQLLLKNPKLTPEEREARRLLNMLTDGDACIGDDNKLYIYSAQLSKWVVYEDAQQMINKSQSVDVSHQNAFTSNVVNQEARTENNMKARISTASPLVDLFFKIGASRGKDIIPEFVAAFMHDKEKAMRIALWVRDCRGGAGERKLFRDILLHLEDKEPDYLESIIDKVLVKCVELGRFDDLLIFKTEKFQQYAFKEIAKAIQSNNGLCAKWMPRKGQIAAQLTKYLKLTPKHYRKVLVHLTKVVETKMCAKQWEDINFKQVPSLAASRYQKAFKKHSKKYAEYLESLKKGETTIHASILYPYDVIKSLRCGDIAASVAQWEALPNYMGDDNVLAVVDVSGSMHTNVGGRKSNVQAIDVSLSLGLYIADKAKGAFKDTFLTFSSAPQLLQVQGNLSQKLSQMNSSQWNMSTNLHGCIDLILRHGVKFNVPKQDMPQMLIILSDMQFDQCAQYDDSAMEMIRRKYELTGYDVPKIVFWNLNARDNVPVKYNEQGVALVSGFSPSLMKSILKAKDFRPESVMLETIMSDRYAI